MRALIGFAINLYRRTPLYPHLGHGLARMLSAVQRAYRGGMFVHDTGPFRINIDLEQRIDAKVYYTGTWEPETVQTIDRLLTRDGVAVDIGANIGYLTLVMASRTGKSGRVIAFEPTSWTYGRLRANIV